MSIPLKLLFVAGERGGDRKVRIALEREHQLIRAVTEKDRKTHIQLLQPIFSATLPLLIGGLHDSFPDIVHFAGHGTERRLQLLNDSGQSSVLSTEEAIAIFKSPCDLPNSHRVRLIVLNTCNSLDVARMLVASGAADFAIGTSGVLADDHALRFAEVFYSSLARGIKIDTAFELGRIATKTHESSAMETTQLFSPPSQVASATAVGSSEATPSEFTAVKSVVAVDMVGFSSICKQLEEGDQGLNLVAELYREIEGLIGEALQVIGFHGTTDIPYVQTGDGAIVALDEPERAERFAKQLHVLALKRNLGKPGSHEVKFRIGIATESIHIARLTAPDGDRPIGFAMAGITISNAVRIQSASDPSEILIDSETWTKLPKESRLMYQMEEEIKGKREEKFRVHRFKMDGGPRKKTEERTPHPLSKKGHFDEEYHLEDVDRLCAALDFNLKACEKVNVTPPLSRKLKVWDILYQKDQLWKLPDALRRLGYDKLARELEHDG